MKYAVISTTIQDPENSEDEDMRVTFHVLCGADGRPDPNRHSFGWRGVPNYQEATFFPFLLKRTGQLDFGSGFEDTNERYGSTSLLDLDSFERGVVFDFNEGDDRDVYIIFAVDYLMETAV